MGRQWERQLLLPFSFYIDAKVLLFFELAKFNLECELHGQKCETSGSASCTGRNVRRVGELFAHRSLILRSLFAHCSLIVYSSYIVLFVFLIFTSSKFFILLSYFDCISIC